MPKSRSFVLLCAASALFAADWPQWRGPARDGRSPETGLLKQWPPGGPRLVWNAQGLGEGYSSISVSQGLLFTQGQRGNSEYVMAFDAATGRKLWETPNGAAYRESRGNGPRGAPTVEADRLWAYSADGTLACLETKTGKRVWQFNAVQRYSGSVPTWGISESPLIDGDRVIVNTGGRGAAVVALNKNTGDLVWKSQNDGAAYASSILAESGGVRQILSFTARGALALRADNGELLWRYNQVANNTANVATPIFRDGFAFFSSDYGTGGALLRLQPEGERVRASEVYFSRDMQNHYSTSVLNGDYLYGYSNAILTAMRWSTGEVAWKNRSVGKGSVVYADGELYCQGEDGYIGLIDATPEAYRERSRFAIKKSDWPLWTQPVIANGRLYVRDQDVLHSYEIRAKTSP